MKSKGPIYFFIFLLILLHNTAISQNKIDIGIFESAVQDTLVIRCRPNYNIPAGYYITNIQFTLKWPETSNVTQLLNISSSVNSFFQISPQQLSVNNGYRYQVYSMVGAKFVTWVAGQEYPVLEILVNYPGGCTDLEITNDTYANFELNGGYYISVTGANKTGIRYQPTVSLLTQGGTVISGETICLGSSTSVMTLSGYSGDVLTWQKKHDNNGWANIAGTAGMSQYYSTPDSSGSYQYRAKVQRATCDTAYSAPASIIVEGLSTWNGTTDTLWNNPGNWNSCGVPIHSRDAEIPAVTTNLYPSIVTAVQCKSLTVRSGATLKILSSGNLDVNGATYQPIYPVIQSE